MRTAALVSFCLALASPNAAAFNLSCKLRPQSCFVIQGDLMPFDEAEALGEDCSIFTRGNVGARAVTMSWPEVLKATASNVNHPLMMAHLAYSRLYDSPLKYSRRVPIKQAYAPIRVACGQVFSDLGMTP